HGQSPWIDNLSRPMLRDGRLAGLVDQGIRGVTSNPTIFAKSISAGSDYDEKFAELLRNGDGVEDAYWDMVVADIAGAMEELAAVHRDSGGGDGFVSLEVAPALAHDTEATLAAARCLFDRIVGPNLLVKVPATAEGVAAVRSLVADGRSINITLIFSIERYGEVIEAYLAGLEEYQGDLSGSASVASFFISRVDTEVDRRLDAIGSEAALGLRGQAAVAQGRLAYALFAERFTGPRWEALVARGARCQRPLWASTSTKNPAYPELLYVDSLIGPNTVNTMPDATVEAFLDRGTLACTVDSGLDQARRTMDDLAGVGVDMADVARVLEAEGVASFAKSFDDLLEALTAKAAALHPSVT
ncbi:MAG: transaldolase, partial [Acidimicrobiales bacterium]